MIKLQGKTKRMKFFWLMIGLFLACINNDNGFAATFYCSSGDATCLREKINMAQWQQYPGPDTIVLEGGIYSLDSAYEWVGNAGTAILLGTEITIKGAGAGGSNPTIIRRQNNSPNFRIFRVMDFGDITVDGVIIENGSVDGDGGGVFNDGRLSIKNSIIRNCSATGDGGGIYNRYTFFSTIAGDLTIKNTTINSNTATRGGGIYNFRGDVNIYDSSIHGNSADLGGGITNYSWLNQPGYMVAINCTIANNSADFAGGIDAASYNYTRLINCTISGNSASQAGGIAAYGYTELQNTILAGNIAPDGPNLPTYNTFTSLGHNLTGCYMSNCPTYVEGDINILPSVDPKLGNFTYDGRPGNGHFPLLSNSPAKDAGNAAACTAFDQLDFPRRDGTLTGAFDTNVRCDIGAIEYQPPTRYRFVVMADSRDDGAIPGTDHDGVNERDFPRVMQSISELLPQPSFILFGGDLVQGRAEKSIVEPQLSEWKDIVDSYFPISHVYPAFGGHEQNTDVPMYSAFSRVFDPKNYGALTCSDYYGQPTFGKSVYYCDYMNARFFILNNDLLGHELGDGQMGWLGSNLKTGSNDLNFFIHHEPVYGTAAHAYMVSNLITPLDMGLKQNGRTDYVRKIGCNRGTSGAMVFSGHEHQYTRRLINQALWGSTCSTGTFQDFYEVKTGTAGVNHALCIDNCRGKDDCKGHEGECQYFLTNLKAGPPVDRSTPFDFTYDGGAVKPHYAVVDVYNNNIEMKVIAVEEKNVAGTATASCSSGTGCTNIRDGNYTTEWVSSGTVSQWTQLNWPATQPVTVDTVVVYDRDSMNEQILSARLDFSDGSAIDVDALPNLGTAKTITFPPKSITSVRMSVTGVSSSSQQIGLREIEVFARSEVLIDAFTYPHESRPTFVDFDQDGALDVEETSGWRKVPISATGEIDSDSDSIPDYKDNNTARVHTATGEGQVAIRAMTSGQTLQNVKGLHDADPALNQTNRPAGKIYKFGIFTEKIIGVGSNASAQLQFIFPSNVAADYEYFKADQAHWWTTPVPIIRNANTFTLTLRNGNCEKVNYTYCEDIDGISTNTEIVDPGNVLVPKPQIINHLVTFTPQPPYVFTPDVTGCVPSRDYDTGLSGSFVGKYGFSAKLVNTSTVAVTIYDLAVSVNTLTGGNLLLNASGGPAGVGSTMHVPEASGYLDKKLEKDESVDVPFIICLRQKVPFRFFVDVVGRKQ